jgi:hypothetical protein
MPSTPSVDALLLPSNPYLLLYCCLLTISATLLLPLNNIYYSTLLLSTLLLCPQVCDKYPQGRRRVDDSWLELVIPFAGNTLYLYYTLSILYTILYVYTMYYTLYLYYVLYPIPMLILCAILYYFNPHYSTAYTHRPGEPQGKYVQARRQDGTHCVEYPIK